MNIAWWHRLSAPTTINDARIPRSGSPARPSTSPPDQAQASRGRLTTEYCRVAQQTRNARSMPIAPTAQCRGHGQRRHQTGHDQGLDVAGRADPDAAGGACQPLIGDCPAEPSVDLSLGRSHTQSRPGLPRPPETEGGEGLYLGSLLLAAGGRHSCRNRFRRRCRDRSQDLIQPPSRRCACGEIPAQALLQTVRGVQHGECAGQRIAIPRGSVRPDRLFCLPTSPGSRNVTSWRWTLPA